MADYLNIPGDRIKLEACCKLSLIKIRQTVIAGNKIDHLYNFSTLIQAILSGNIPETIFNLQGGFVDSERIAQDVNVIGQSQIDAVINEEAFVNHSEIHDSLHKFWVNMGRAWIGGQWKGTL
jgi:hypothetical protein